MFEMARDLDDATVIGLAAAWSFDKHNLNMAVTGLEMEMQRRFKDSVVALTAELVTFRESADKAASRADAAAGRLTRLTWALIGFTAVLVVLTVVLVILTVRLLALG